MSDLRQAASFALTTLQGWSNHDHWLWPQSALAQAKQNTTEAISLLEVALAEPEPEDPTPSDEELELLADRHTITDGQTGAVYLEHLDYAHAILARLGNHQGMLASSMPQPIPASERLPEVDDCDADGRCWVGYPVTKEMEDEDLNPSWELCQINPDDEYWLPANALPQPS